MAVEKWIFFIDTNVFLDFYRISGESAKRQLETLEKHSNLLITSEQVRMEFLKNRQKVIAKTITDLKAPSRDGVPSIFSESKPATALKSSKDVSVERFKKLKEYALKYIENPSSYDKVFKTFNRIYTKNSDLNLSRTKKTRFEIRNLARKRFSLGYPPRKSSDTSIGDSVNWEWIIKCAQNESGNPHVMIVSRDGDFGVTLERRVFLNDWLYREFKDRVGIKRKIVLTDSLTVALKKMGEIVSAEDEAEEKAILKNNMISPVKKSDALLLKEFLRFWSPVSEIEGDEEIIVSDDDLDDLV
jgi:predicted nucleic acid-binding protein